MTKMNYVQTGDYSVPDLQLEMVKDRSLGKYGRMRKVYLQEHNTLLYNHLILTEKLFPHLWEVQDTATGRIEQMMKELLEQNPAPDKKTDQMGWVLHMNMLKAQAEEIVLAELIYN